MTDLFAIGPLLVAGAFAFGAVIGSFLNVVILRLPRQLEYEWRCDCADLLEISLGETDPPPGLAFPPSCCPKCGHQIRAWENIPIVSFLLLRGRCSSCKTKISWRYPLVEALTGLAFVIVAVNQTPGLSTLTGFLFAATLVALSGIDLDHQLLPDNVTLPFLWVGLALSLIPVTVDTRDSVMGALAGYLVLWVVFQGFKLLTGKEGMGFGDFKLTAALGAWLGWQMLPLIILLASLIGAVTGILLLMARRSERSQPMPFGPFLALAGFVALVWGETIISHYLTLSGLA